jgi:LasA protease
MNLWARLGASPLPRKMTIRRALKENQPGLRQAARWILGGVLLGCSACVPEPAAAPVLSPQPTIVAATLSAAAATPLPSREAMEPGTLVEYRAQSGDFLEAIAAHFNTTAAEIRKNNPGLPQKLTTLEPGRILRVPVYWEPFTGTPFQMLPDSEVIGGPAGSQFSGQKFIDSSAGYLKTYSEYVFAASLSGWQVVQTVARDFSINPRLLLALLEYRSGAVSRDDQSDSLKAYPLGSTDFKDIGLGMQLSWAAAQLNEGYYGWRDGSLDELELEDGRISRPDPWQNAGTVAVQYLLAKWFGQAEFDEAIGPDGFIQTYRKLFGDPFSYSEELIPGDLEQPALQLPFEPNKVWVYSGGPHPVWGDGLPWAAVDFAPPAEKHGCVPSPEWVTAIAPGLIVRSGPATVVLDLDGDGNEHTGWVVFYYHIAETDRIAAGTQVQAGALIGHPSCEGGTATGTHTHLARRYNGEWIPAGGLLPFNLSGWIVAAGKAPYQGTLSYYLETTLIACDCVSPDNRIMLFPSATPTP